jgi:hypothetical protein
MPTLRPLQYQFCHTKSSSSSSSSISGSSKKKCGRSAPTPFIFSHTLPPTYIISCLGWNGRPKKRTALQSCRSILRLVGHFDAPSCNAPPCSPSPACTRDCLTPSPTWPVSFLDVDALAPDILFLSLCPFVIYVKESALESSRIVLIASD